MKASTAMNASLDSTKPAWLQTLQAALKHEACGGVLLIIATIAAMFIANSSLAVGYFGMLETKFTVAIGDATLSKPVLLWINDGLMAFFFLIIGLELKREILVGQLSTKEQIMLPAAGAVGGLVLPAGIYAVINWGNASAMQGWAIPAATDIAFAVGILALLGKRVPSSLKVFLISLAIFDDLAAIMIIALFYTSDLSMTALGGAGIAIAALYIINLMGVKRLSVYMVVGAFLWFCLLKSGVHATLAGVALAAFIPLHIGKSEPLHDLEHGLHPWVTFLVIPVFALANAGIPLTGMSLASLAEPIPLGILLGLFIGKQVGAFSCAWLLIKSGIGKLPKGSTWLQLYGVCILTGIGFTMSLFISGLAFEHTGENTVMTERIGILAGSFLSAIVGAGLLIFANKNSKTTSQTE